MKILQEKRLEFIKEGVKFYSEDTSRRAFDPIEEICKYRQGDNKCMIGRHIPDDKYNENLEGHNIDDIVLRFLPKNIVELGIDFLEYCQSLHDTHIYWNKRKGLTKLGKKGYQYIINRFCTI